MVKKITVLTLLICLIASVTVFAASDYIATGSTGNSYGIISIARPDSAKAVTYSNSYYVSGSGKNGTVVTFYKYDSKSNAYSKMYSNGYALSMTVGQSGVFWTTLPLSYGDNYFAVLGECGSSTQICYFRLTYQSSLMGINPTPWSIR